MRLLGANTHNPINKNVARYRIDWDAPSLSKVQWATKQFLKPFWKGCLVYEEFPVYQTRLRVDILNASRKVAVEVHGGQHTKFNKHFHNNSRQKYLDSLTRDSLKMDWLILNDFDVVEIYEKEVPKLTKEWFEDKFKIAL
tara:strand:- start:143 stop:562 length:420 start_codon:yes stop_codon:yes gene_type:complete